MKINLVNVVTFGVGAILLYSGIQGYDPRDTIKWGLGGKRPRKVYGKEARITPPRKSADPVDVAPDPVPVDDDGWIPGVSV